MRNQKLIIMTMGIMFLGINVILYEMMISFTSLSGYIVLLASNLSSLALVVVSYSHVKEESRKQNRYLKK